METNAKRAMLLPGEILFNLFMIGLAAFALVYLMVKYSSKGFVIILFPLLASSAIILLGLVKLRTLVTERSAFLKSASGEELQSAADKQRADLFKTLRALGYIALLPALFILLGTDLSFPLFELIFLKLKKQSWKVAVAYAVIMFVLVHFFFGRLLGIRTFPGILFGGRM